MNLQQVTKSFGGMLTKNSPSILTGLGVAGLIATTVMAVKATPKALQILDDAHIRNANETLVGDPVRELTPQEMVLLTWRCYLPAATMGLITIGCIISANRVNLKRNAALVGLYSLSETALKEYQAKVVETIGKPKERQIKDEIAKDKIVSNPISQNEIFVTGKGNTLCYDSLSGRYFRSDLENIRQVCNKLSRDLMSENYITLNEVYDGLGLKSNNMGEIIGWHIDDGLIEPSFSAQIAEDGNPCLVLDFVTEPRYNYNNY